MLAVAAIVAEHYARGGPVDSIAKVIAKLADADAAVAEPIVRGLAKGWIGKAHPKLDADLDKNLGRLAGRLSTTQRLSVVKLAGAWGSKQFEADLAEITGSILAKVKNEKTPTAERLSAAHDLVSQRPTDSATAKAIVELINPRTGPELAKGLFAALQSSDAPDIGQLLSPSCRHLPRRCAVPRSVC